MRPSLRHHLTLFSLLLLAAVLAARAPARAQTPATDDWTPPINLSQSGTAGAPQMVIDSSGRSHLLWSDSFRGLLYASGSGESWSAATPVALPFADTMPTLAATPDNQIHAFWTTAGSDEDALPTLQHSRVPAGQFSNPLAWSTPQSVTSSVVSLAVASDSAGRLHLASLRVSDQVAGLYYQKSEDGGSSWSDPRSLYQSDYLRLLAAGSTAGMAAGTANVQLIAGDGDNLYLAWDNPPLQQAFTTLSRDSGQLWQIAAELPRPEDEFAPAGASQVRLASQGSQLHRLWLAGSPDSSCAYYHQRSDDRGATWSPAGRVLTGRQRCPSQASLLSSASAIFLLAGDPAAGQTLSVWNGQAWGDEQPQPAMSGFTTTGDQPQNISYNCGQAVAVAGETLLLASCGAAQTTGQDIWITGRALTPLVALAAAPPIWHTPAPLAAAGSEDAGSTPLWPILLADDQNRLHAVWSLAADDAAGQSLGQQIMYARWDGQAWSRPVPIVSGSGSSLADHPALALSRDGRLLLVWRGDAAGQIYFSWASAERATSTAEWATPQPLPMPRPEGGAPTISVDRAGVIYVVYPLPLNEGRGLYLTTSADNGQRWTPPEQIFDGAAAGWGWVDAPQLARTGDDSLHLLWQRRGLPGAANGASLAYARSDDGGLTWSAPTPVENGTANQGAVLWQQLLGDGEQVVHRAWQEWDGRQRRTWHQVSLDNGQNWARAGTIGDFNTPAGATTLALDPAGQLYALQLLAATAETPPALAAWLWDGARWTAVEGYDLPAAAAPASTALTAALAAAIAPDGALGVLYPGHAAASDSPPPLYFTGRALPLPETLPTPLPTLTPTPPPTATPSPTSLPQPTPTVVFPTTNEGLVLPGIGELAGNNVLVAGAVLALIPAGLIILLALLYYLRPGRR